MHLDISSVYKLFGDDVALDRISLGLERSEFVCLLGPSGCGKSTLLRIIAGLLPYDGGRITLAGKDLAEMPARERNFGIVFQSYSLFPHMTVAANIGYGLKLRGRCKREIAQRSEEMMALVRLPHLADRYPHQLSGGQQQRVAIARALAIEPSLILLDEPLSALDAKVRAEMRIEIRDVQRRLGIPILMVTHDQDEALSLADKVVCMNHGMIEQIGSPEELYLRPRNRFVADFVGANNLLPTALVRERFPTALASRPAGGDEEYLLCVRPEFIALDPGGTHRARIVDTTFLGNLDRLRLDFAGLPLIAEHHCHQRYEHGQTLGFEVNLERCAWVHQ